MSDLEAIKSRMQQTWASGDFAMIGTTNLIVGEMLCEAVDVRPGWKVLDVATGSGNTALAAARRFCDVTGVDFVPALLERARERAAAERLQIAFHEGDAERLPFPDASFDVVLSTFGAMFAPNQE
ncbi:MAG: methyltransferase domain-containing protein, partial [Bacillati bacterium ANGP1]